MIDTVLFDMDGLLLDTEPLWGESMLRVANTHGIPITADKFKETTGLRIYEVTDYWSRKYHWEGSTPVQVADEILDDIIAVSKQKGNVMPGVITAIDLLKTNNIKISVASSSPMRMIDELLIHFNIKSLFDDVTSADVVEFGKPNPGVFLHSAMNMGAHPLQCVVLEDSVNGMIAAKSARMKVVIVPDKAHYDKPEFALADAKLRSLEEFDIDLLKRL